MDYIDNILGQYGFGESVSLGGKTTRIETDVEPDHQAYAECYAYTLRDEVMMENEKLAMHIEVARIRAAGEDLKEMADKVKDKVKEGKDKIKKFLLELYDKVIRFFTETVRYFFSNEKKSSKLIAEMKAAIKKSAKTGEGTVKVFDPTSLKSKMSGGEGYHGFGEEDYPEGTTNQAKKIVEAKKNQNLSADEYRKKSEEFAREAGKAKKFNHYETKIQVSEIFANKAKAIVAKQERLQSRLQAASELIERSSNATANSALAQEELSTARHEIADSRKVLQARAEKIKASLKRKPSEAIVDIQEETSAISYIDDTLTIISNLKTIEGDDTAVKDQASSIIELVKESYDTKDEIFKDIIDNFNSNRVDMNYQDAHEALKGLLEFGIYLLEGQRNAGTNMKGLNKKIRKFTEEKRKIEKSIKEANKEDNEDEGKELQKKRMSLIYCIKATSLFKGREDRSLGYVMQIGRLVLNDYNKVSK